MSRACVVLWAAVFAGCTSGANVVDVQTEAAVDTATDTAPDMTTGIPCGMTTCVAPMFCCTTTGNCADNGCLTCCSPAPHDAGDVAMDVVNDVPGHSCVDSFACNPNEDCVYATAGCGRLGRCVPQQTCTRPLMAYCGCDGFTVMETCAGPPAAWVSLGPCDAGASDAAVDAVDAGSDF